MFTEALINGINLGFRAKSQRAEEERRQYEMSRRPLREAAQQMQLEQAGLGLRADRAKLDEATAATGRSSDLRLGLRNAYANSVATKPYEYSRFDDQEAPEAGLKSFAPELGLDARKYQQSVESAYQTNAPELAPEIMAKHGKMKKEGIQDAMIAAASGNYDAATKAYNEAGNDRALFTAGSKPGFVKITEANGTVHEEDPVRFLTFHGVIKPKAMIHARPGDSVYDSEGNIVSTAPYPKFGDLVADDSGAKIQSGPGGEMKTVVKPPAAKGFGLGQTGKPGKSSAWIQKQDRLMTAYGVDEAGAVEIAQMLESDPGKLANAIVESKRRAAASAFEAFDEGAAQRAATDQVRNTQKELGIGGMVNAMQRKGTPDPKNSPSPAYMQYLDLYNKAIKAGHADIAAKMTERARAGGVVR